MSLSFTLGKAKNANQKRRRFVKEKPNKTLIQRKKGMDIIMENTNTELITSKNCVSSQNIYSEDHELSTIIREAIVFLGCEGRAYFKVTLPAAPAGAAVTRAELILTSPVYDLVNVNNFTLYQTSAFDPASLTWSNQPSILSTVSAEQLNGSVGKLNIDFTELYEDDLSEKTLYLAFYPVIRNVDDGNGGCYYETVQTSFYSENYSAGKPVANIYYVSSEKLLQNTEYLEIDMGRSGKGQINLFNGNLSFTHTLFNIAGTSLPVSIATVHNRDVESSDVTWGNRFFSPLQTLVYNENAGSGEPKAVYTDASGYKHYFKQSSYINENNQSVSALRDTAGLNLICTESDEISGGHEMMDKSGNKMLFDSSGKLVRIDDRLGNFVQYIYSDGLPTKIKAGSYEYKNSESKLYVYNLEYSGNRLYKVTGPSNQSATFSSSKATYSDEKSTTFSFSSGKLTRVSDSDGLICEITYRSGTDRVSSVSYYSNYSSYGETTVTSKTLIDKVNITYTGRTTTVTGRDGSKTIYNFDDSGKAILTYAKAPGSSGLPIPSSTPCIVNRYKGEEEKFGIVIPEYREITVRTDNDCRSNIVGDPNFNNLVIGFNSAAETWSTTAQGTLTSSSTSFIPGTRSVYFTGTGVGKGAYQFINFGNISHKENLLVFSAWAKAQFAVRSTDKTRFEISVDATYENGQKITYSCKYNHKITDWQFAAVAVETMKLFPKTNGTGYESSMLSKVGLWLDFAGNNGSCYFNAPRLEFCNGEITEYMLTESEDENETNYVMLETSVNNGTHTVTTTHNKYFLPTKEVIRDKSGTEFKTDLTYSTDGRLKSKLDYHGAQTSYSYTTGGKIKRKAVQMGLNGKTIQTKKNYSEDEKHVSSEADENNSWVIYDYDSTTDQLTKVTTSNSQEYNYTYNSALELTGISSTVGGTSNANDIGYNMGYVTELHGKTPSTNESERDFRFTYDWKGRNKKITVAEEDLAEYSYD